MRKKVVMMDSLTCEHAKVVLKEWVQSHKEVSSAMMLPNASDTLAVSLVVSKCHGERDILQSLRNFLDVPMTISMVRH